MAIVKLPYLYRVRGIAPGQRSSKIHKVLDFVLIDAPELSPKEVPVGFEVHARLKKDRTVLLSLRVARSRPMSIRAWAP